MTAFWELDRADLALQGVPGRNPPPADPYYEAITTSTAGRITLEHGDTPGEVMAGLDRAIARTGGSVETGFSADGRTLYWRIT